MNSMAIRIIRLSGRTATQRAQIGVFFVCLAFLAAKTTYAQTPPEVLQAYLGRALLLAHVAGDKDIKVKRDKLDNLSRGCDAAVLVTNIRWQGDRAEFQDLVGNPEINHKSLACRESGYPKILHITGFEPDEPATSLNAAIGKVLQTPEQYLAEHAEEVAKLKSSPDVPMPNRPDETQPVLLLNVTATYTEQARLKRISGSVLMSVIVDANGIPQSPQVVRTLGFGLDESAVKAVMLQRFRPAMKDGQPVAVRAQIAMNFNLL